MNIPDSFYYTLPQGKKRYSRTFVPGSRFDVSRWFRNAAAFELPAPARRKAPKTLILADWRLPFMKINDKVKLAELLQALMEKGFQVLLWRENDSPIPLDSSTLWRIHNAFERRLYCPVPEDIHAAATKALKCPPDALMVLDDVQLYQLEAAPEAPLIRHVRAEYAVNIDILDFFLADREHSHKDKFIHWLKASKWPALMVFHASMDEQEKETLTADFKLPSLTKGDTFNCRNADAQDGKVFHVTKTTDGIDFSGSQVGDYPKLSAPLIHVISEKEELKGFRDLPADEIRALIKQSTTIRCKDALEIYQILSEAETLSRLQSLWCHNNYLELLHRAPGLRLLEVRELETPESWPKLPVLESLKIMHKSASINLPNLARLTPDLRALEIGSGAQHSFVSKHLPPSLEYLSLPEDGVQLRPLYKTLPNLRHLIIKSEYSLNTFLNYPSSKKLPSLKKLELDIIKMVLKEIAPLNLKCFRMFLNDFPNLDTLIISYPAEMIGLNLAHVTNDTVETLILKKVKLMASEMLPEMIQNFKKLKVLDLRECIELKHHRLTREMFPPHLTVYLPENHLEKWPWENSASHHQAASSTSVTRQPVPPPASPPAHTLDKLLDLAPPDPDEHFVFNDPNPSQAQASITQRLGQYLSLKKRHASVIPKLQKGMCAALASAFLERPHEWNALLQRVILWNGEGHTLTEAQEADFEYLFTCFQRRYLDKERMQAPTHYLGDALKSFLSANKKACEFSNSWHQIAICPSGDDWMFYDPNHPEGAVCIRKNALASAIGRALGNLVATTATVNLKSAQIQKPEAFLREGGLLRLAHDPWLWHDYQHRFKRHRFSAESLHGLLLRDNEGLPAWFRAWEALDLKSFVQTLLKAFLKNPNHHALFAKSLEHLSGLQRTDVNAWLKSQGLTSPMLQAAPKARNPWLSTFKTWTPEETFFQTREAFCQHHLRGAGENRLLRLESDATLDATALALQKHCLDTGRPFFYLHAPEDLACDITSFKRDSEGRGIPVAPPSGRLHDFLTRHASDNPVIIVNYSAFEVDDLVRTNALLDTVRRVDNTPVPANALVIGLINDHDPECYRGADFYSRFHHAETVTLSLDTLNHGLPELNSAEARAEDMAEVLPLYHANDWKERLLGQWVYSEGVFHWQEGLLPRTSAPLTRLVIGQGLWNDREFINFWREVRLHGGVWHEGEFRPIAKEVTLLRVDHYPWEQYRAHVISTGTIPPAECHVLNPACLHAFMQGVVVENATLKNVPGLIERFSGGTLPVYLTTELDDDNIAMLADMCAKHHVTLDVLAADGIRLPEALNLTLQHTAHSESPWSRETPPQALTIICSLDPDTTEAMMHLPEGIRILDISECTIDDLLERLQVLSHGNTIPAFALQHGGLLSAPDDVLLKGTPPKALLEALTPALLKHRGPNRITLILTEPMSGLPYFTHAPTAEDKLQFLPQATSLEPQLLLDEPLATLKARTTSPDINAPFIGLTTSVAVPQLPPFHERASARPAAEVDNERRRLIEDVLDRSPFVFIAGLSGVGKSTFIRKGLTNAPVHHGIAALSRWATDETPGRKILFIDEANLQNTDWSLFEGLFAHPPGVLFEGIFYPLTPEHKVIFAGNPLQYKGERNLPTLFKRHGNSVVFDPLPPDYIYENILRGIVEAPHINAPFMDVYSELVACSLTDILITPRELEMMAHLTAAYCTRHPESDPHIVARHYAFKIAQPLVPESHQNDFITRFKTELPVPDALPQLQNIILTPSREPLCHTLCELLEVREWRQRQTNDAQRFGGLGALVTEGPPGVGKSELVLNTLIARGYEELHDLNAPFTPETRTFVRLPANLSLSEKLNVLNKAFQNGIVVIADEINSSPMLEEHLNDLLMGLGPDKNRPPHPGFLLIGTQNPANMGGRLEASPALKHRQIQITLDEYPREEVHAILQGRGLADDVVIEMTDAWLRRRNEALAMQATPLPSFRDLMNAVNTQARASASTQSNTRSCMAAAAASTSALLPVSALSELEKLQACVSNAVRMYRAFHQSRGKTAQTDRNFGPGCLTFFGLRHTQRGIQDAERLLRKIENATNFDSARALLDKFMEKYRTGRHTHSLSSYLMDELQKAFVESRELQEKYSSTDWQNLKTRL
ncbi:hypothetical protein Lgee_0768 [Legionella geestiana]|uniref:Uncharacterized protein n=1 Tax=Legionella geestiana TaxID=45065 RepID=A0A0W0U2Y0_9GAMM|nr:hypothetical protein [Legionella geestiana]KTD02076.1 hypothetical protein Lgee_0768 [Legionella geestiana]QBS11872.1 hypothetical protein E4T54_03420 [Legionella geestiana]QDQ40516.1 hypothetical protein E3226_009005 [Legionella geestiana]STX53427.1 AAA ATPase containing von Willebrand factor type A (vWA) domain [Legionella geestiana]